MPSSPYSLTVDLSENPASEVFFYEFEPKVRENGMNVPIFLT
ncbi:hypothetical protein Msip34_2848 (plasmid) [Methylovorus glucosotrophus SIP3-4]|uniref:Uncharacterized protein n=1 Tax=Methylovorus glucosotrophus (strain SIP3-4) TaxID=582744 RepID=C6XEL5_METGS|nr:hypothetical protein Msip34_2848 [Methylovorus glucosotrophus SIP3-4]